MYICFNKLQTIMSFTDLFDSGHHQRNVGHFAAIVNIASVHGDIHEEEENILKRLAKKLDINESDYDKIIKNPSGYPVNPPNSSAKRLERLYDVFTLIFADHVMDKDEEFLLKRYAVALGFDSETSQEIIDRSVKILGGKLSFDDYLYLLERKD